MLHPTVINESLHIGKNTKVWANTHLSKGCIIGDDCVIGEGVFIGEGVIIGDGCRIQNGAQIFKGVILENDVFIAPCVVTTNDIFPQLPCEDWSDRFKSTLIKKGASIGANSTIVCGVIIGEKSLIGAGSVVTKNIPNNQLWFGNPAKFKKQL